MATTTVDAAKESIRRRVWDDLERVATAIHCERALGPIYSVAIRLEPGLSAGGPTLVIETDNMDGNEVAKAMQLAGRNLELELVDGKLAFSSPAWPPDRIPF